MEIDRSKPVLVTGANGYVASWLVKSLLEDGFHVHGTVRNPDNEKKVGHLRKMAEGAPGKLTLFKAELLQEGAFDEPMKGCELVFHTASPCIVRGIKDPKKELIEPAEQGTKNVLEAANRIDSVKRIVLTTSVVAVYGDAVDINKVDGDQFNEQHWNFSSTETHQPYSYSKTVAERLAWDIVKKQKRWDLVCVNPGVVFGPALTQQSDSESIAMMRDMGNGMMKFGSPDLSFGIVDVRDVAKAHMQAGLVSEASGRHILVSGSISVLDMGGVLRNHFGSKYPFPKFNSPKFLIWLLSPLLGLDRSFVKHNVGYPFKFDNSYTRKDLKLEFRPMEETIIGHFQQLLDDGLLKKRE